MSALNVYPDHIEVLCECGITHKISEVDGKPKHEQLYRKPSGSEKPEEDRAEDQSGPEQEPAAETSAEPEAGSFYILGLRFAKA